MYGFEFSQLEGQDLLLLLTTKGLGSEHPPLRVEANKRKLGLLLAIDLHIIPGDYALALD